MQPRRLIPALPSSRQRHFEADDTSESGKRSGRFREHKLPRALKWNRLHFPPMSPVSKPHLRKGDERQPQRRQKNQAAQRLHRWRKLEVVFGVCGAASVPELLLAGFVARKTSNSGVKTMRLLLDSEHGSHQFWAIFLSSWLHDSRSRLSSPVPGGRAPSGSSA